MLSDSTAVAVGGGGAHVYKHALKNDSDGAACDLERVGSELSLPVGISGKAAGRKPGGASECVTTNHYSGGRACQCVRSGGSGTGGHHERHEISCSEMADTKLMRVTMTMAKCSFISLDSTRSISISFCVPIEA